MTAMIRSDTPAFFNAISPEGDRSKLRAFALWMVLTITSPEMPAPTIATISSLRNDAELPVWLCCACAPGERWDTGRKPRIKASTTTGLAISDSLPNHEPQDRAHGHVFSAVL